MSLGMCKLVRLYLARTFAHLAKQPLAHTRQQTKNSLSKLGTHINTTSGALPANWRLDIRTVIDITPSRRVLYCVANFCSLLPNYADIPSKLAFAALQPTPQVVQREPIYLPSSPSANHTRRVLYRA
jgi:hypothetical protein